MTHIACSQIKPSLSVRTRALTNKYHAKVANQRAFAGCRVNSRLRNRGTYITRQVFDTQNNLTKSDDTAHLFDHNNKQTITLPTNPVLSKVDTHNEPSSSCTSSSTCASFNCSSSVSSVSSTSYNQASICKWEGCECVIIEKTQLVNHIQQTHVLPQFISNRRRYFCCLWRGCRVFGRPSVSAVWLEHHILHHTDAKGKPFRCIFDSCTLRFSTSTLLERHVQRTHIRGNINRTVIHDGGLSTSLSVNKSLRTSSHLNTESNHELRSIKQSVSLNQSNGRKNPRRRKKPRVYRVRRIDFYDHRTQLVIRNHLKIQHILHRNFDVTSEETKPIWAHSIDPLPKLSLIPVRTRLRSFDEKSSFPEETSFTHQSSKLRKIQHVFEHVFWLLTFPHTLVGQRLSEGQRTEYLVRWAGDSNDSHRPPTWIYEEDLRAAALIEQQLCQTGI